MFRSLLKLFSRNFAVAFLFCLVLSAFAISPGAFARSGGGHTSYSGHSSSVSYGHSSYGGSGFGAVPMYYGGGSSGQFLFLIVILIILFLIVSKNRVNRTGDEDAASDLLLRSQMNLEQGRYLNLTPFDPESIRQFDPKFSVPAFMDFTYALYAITHKMRGENSLQTLTPYLSPEVIAKYEQLSPLAKEVKGIVVSGCRLISGNATENNLVIRIHFDANYTESTPGKPDQSFYAQETWVLSKKKTVPSLIPSKLRQISCPNCGAPPSFSEDGKCSACGTIVHRGDFNWSIESVELSRMQTPPLLTSTVEEEGTDLPTVFAPDLVQKETAFAAKYPNFKFSQFQKRAEETYFAAQSAWTERKPEIARPYESENIFQMHQYWISEYLKQGMINVLKNVSLHKIEAVKLDQDEFFESMTVRMYGSMIDYTIYEADQKIVAGDTRNPREFTEYWTFIRSADGGAAKKHDTGCPACGASLKINQSGHCEYCLALVTSGDFDWVLSEIEQDETYHG